MRAQNKEGMMLKNLSENLNWLMSKARINSNELARQTGLPATTIKRIRNLDTANPTVSTLIPIANFFAISISELLGCVESHSNKTIQHVKSKINSIPLLTWRECIKLDDLDFENFPNKISTEKQISGKNF